MPLTQCPECGDKVSTLALTCPHCGLPLKFEQVERPSSSVSEPASKVSYCESSNARKIAAAIIDLIICGILTAISIKYLRDNSVLTPFLALLYLVLRDTYQGSSLGRKFVNLVLVDTSTMQSATPQLCFKRNLYLFSIGWLFYIVIAIVMLTEASNAKPTPPPVREPEIMFSPLNERKKDPLGEALANGLAVLLVTGQIAIFTTRNALFGTNVMKVQR
jgi:hypothetical protein